MTEAIKLTASVREGKVQDLKDSIPAVIYGSGVENMSLVVNRNEFEKVFAQSGESGLISLKLNDGKEYPVIVKDFQTDALKHRIIHIDFYKLDMNEKVVAEVTLHFVGEAPAVKTHGGIVVEHMEEVEIECLPNNLIQKIDVDLSKLAELGDAIYVKDLALPQGVVFKHDLEAMVVNVVEPKKQVEEPTSAPEGASAGKTPVEGEVKTEEEKAEAEDKKE